MTFGYDPLRSLDAGPRAWYSRGMKIETAMASKQLSPREELEIGVMIASELIELIYEDKITPSEIRSTLREVVEEIGIGHTDRHLAIATIHRIRHNLGGKF